MKIDTKYAPSLMQKLAGSKAGALALAMDRLCYDSYEEDGRVHVTSPMYVGKDGGCAWVAPAKGKPDYMDIAMLLREARDELYAIALGETA